MRTEDEVSEIASRIGVSLDEVGVKFRKSWEPNNLKNVQINVCQGNRKNIERSQEQNQHQTTTWAGLHLWWNCMEICMERESLKEAAGRKLQCEDIATSTRLMMFLGCGKDLSKNKNNLNQAGTKDESVIQY